MHKVQNIAMGQVNVDEELGVAQLRREMAADGNIKKIPAGVISFTFTIAVIMTICTSIIWTPMQEIVAYSLSSYDLHIKLLIAVSTSLVIWFVALSLIYVIRGKLEEFELNILVNKIDILAERWHIQWTALLFLYMKDKINIHSRAASKKKIKGSKIEFSPI